MPSIRACGRRLHVSTDDFFFPAVFSVIVRVVWVVLTSIVLYYYRKEEDACENTGHVLDTYLFGALSLTFLSGVLDSVLAYFSSRGAISDTHERRAVPGLLVLRVIVAVPELGWLILGSVWAWQTDIHGEPCPERDLTLIRVAVTSAWILFAILGVLVLVVIDWLGSSKISSIGPGSRCDDGLLSSSTMHAHEAVWQRRCGLCCCICFRCDKKSDADFRTTLLEVSKLFAIFFSGSADVVPTDVAAGLVLVAELQKVNRDGPDGHHPGVSTASSQRQETAITEYGPCAAWRSSAPDGNFNCPSSPIGAVSLGSEMNREAFAQVTHFMKFAMGPYGWPLFVFESLCTGCCQLVPHCRCCAGCQNRDPVIESDCPGCQCNTAAILSWTGIDYDDIIYATFENELLQLPFFVAVDHSHRAVVVSIRGTMSLKDALADLRAAPQSLEVEGHPEFMGHDGIFESSTRIRRRMQDMRLLQRAFEKGCDARGKYDLVFVGHSLGAGVASILSLLYHAEYPTLLCYAYSPPGALVSKECAVFSTEFIVSVILGDDVVPRLSIPNLEDLRVDILNALTNTRHSKPGIFCTACCSTFLPCLCCCQHLSVGDELDPTYPSACADQHPGPGPSSCSSATGGCSVVSAEPAKNPEQPLLARTGLSLVAATVPPMPQHRNHGSMGTRTAAAQAQVLGGREVLYVRHKLYPPGRLLHLAEDTGDGRRCCGSEPVWTPRWITSNELQTILISSDMLSNHLPNHVKATLELIQDSDSNEQAL